MFFILIALIVIALYFVKRRHSAISKIQDCGFPIASSYGGLYGFIEGFISKDAPWNLGKLVAKYGNTVGVMLGGSPAIVTADVDLIFQICQKNYSHFHSRMAEPLAADAEESESVHMFAARGMRWKRLRAITSTTISNKNMLRLFPIIDDSASNFLKTLEKAIDGGNAPVPMHRLFQNHASDVLARCAFGQLDSRQQDNQYHKLFSKAFGQFPKFRYNPESLQWILPEFRLVWIFLQKLSNLIFSKSPLTFFTEHLGELRDGRIPFEDRPDFMQNFKNAEDSNWQLWRTNNDGYVDVSKVRIERKMTPGEIAAQCRFISIAGFDTTSNSLAFTCYLLAKHQDIQAQLIEEIETLPSVTFDGVQSLTLLNAVICESLRIYPHASPLHNRLCMEDCEINGLIFRKGVGILIDSWSIHHDKSIWGDDVEEFRPQRFLNNPPWRAWMPFGVGPRQCVGMRFALLEQKITLCRLFSKYRILPTNIEIQMSLRDTNTVWPDNLELAVEVRK